MPMAAQLIPRAVKRTVPTLHATAQIMLELSTRTCHCGTKTGSKFLETDNRQLRISTSEVGEQTQLQQKLQK